MKNTATGVPPRDALDILFSNRNRTYGAYALRREYPHALIRALVIGLICIGAGLGLPQLIGALSKVLPEKDNTIYCPTVTKVEITPPPPQPPKVQPPRPSIAFLPPIIVPNDKVDNAPPPPPIDSILIDNRPVGAITQKGVNHPGPTLDNGPEPEAIAKIEDTKKEFPIYAVSKQPGFPGGEKEMFRFIQENLKYPAMARENNIQGRVAVTFVINADGSVDEVSILKEIGGGCGKEAARVVAAMPPWIPGEMNGIPVKVRFTIPVQFKLE